MRGKTGTNSTAGVLRRPSVTPSPGTHACVELVVVDLQHQVHDWAIVEERRQDQVHRFFGHLRDPGNRIVVFLAGITASASRNHVAADRFPAACYRDHVIELRGYTATAVGAEPTRVFEQHLARVGTNYGNPTSPRSGTAAHSTAIRAVPLAMSFILVRSTEALAHLGRQQPRCASTTPCLAADLCGPPIGDRRARFHLPTAGRPASRRQSISTRFVEVELAARMPGGTPVAPLQPIGNLRPIEILAHTKPSGSCAYRPRRVSHFSSVPHRTDDRLNRDGRTWDQYPEVMSGTTRAEPCSEWQTLHDPRAEAVADA